jgi:glycosyltransferase involved in cell wall biosynthesis
MDGSANRILFVEGNVDRTIGGSYYSLMFLVAGLDRQRFVPVVVFSTENALIPRFNSYGVRTIVRSPAPPTILYGIVGRVIAKVANFFRGAIIEPLRLAALLRRERIALLHLNNSILRNHPWMIAAWIARIPCITHERGINPRFPLRARLLARRLDAIICISKAVDDNCMALGRTRLSLVTIHNGLDPAEMLITRTPAEIRAELGVPASSRLIGIVGNIKPWKGQEVVVRAMAILRDRFPDVVCLLIGDSSPDDYQYRERIESLVSDSGLDRRVLVTGFRSDIANYINALEILVHASIEPEPFGRVLLEGMALRKPLVASGGGAVPEIVADGETGYLFEPGNAQALADRIATLLADPDLCRETGARGYQRLSTEFSIARNIRETQKVYESLLAR